MPLQPNQQLGCAITGLGCALPFIVMAGAFIIAAISSVFT